MSETLGTTWLSGLTAQHARREAKHRLCFQGGLGSLMLGVFAFCIGLVMQGTWWSAQAGSPVSPLAEQIWRYSQRDARTSPLTEDPNENNEEYLRSGPLSSNVSAPTTLGVVVSILGTMFAVLGILTAHRQQRGIMLLCMLAVVLCWLPLGASFLEEIVVLYF